MGRGTGAGSGIGAGCVVVVTTDGAQGAACATRWTVLVVFTGLAATLFVLLPLLT